MPDTTLPTNEATAPEQLEATEETPETLTALGTQETPETLVDTPVQPEAALEAEIEEELIIEDFTIDGICGVY